MKATHYSTESRAGAHIKVLTAVYLLGSLLYAPTLWGQQTAPQTPAPAVTLAGATTHTIAPTPAQIKACVDALPPEPKAPKPHGKSMFPKLDTTLGKIGIDSGAVRDQMDKAAQDKYQAAKQEYDKLHNACSAPIVVPGTEQALVAPSAAPAVEAKPAAPAPLKSKPVMSADGRHLFQCPKNSTNAPDGILACQTPDGTFVPLQEIPIPPAALPPPPAPQPAAGKGKQPAKQ
jgi:hypothetical protein